MTTVFDVPDDCVWIIGVFDDLLFFDVFDVFDIRREKTALCVCVCVCEWVRQKVDALPVQLRAARILANWLNWPTRLDNS